MDELWQRWWFRLVVLVMGASQWGLIAVGLLTGLALIGHPVLGVTLRVGGVASAVLLSIYLPATLAAFIWSHYERERLGKLAAGLEAEAQLETARAIREVTREVDANQVPAAEDGAGPPPEPESPREAPQRPARESGGIAGAVDRFYAEALLQSRVWFVASLLAALVGLVVIVWELIQASNQPAPDAILKVVSGLLAEAVAALFYRQANATRKHGADLLSSTQSDRRSETALTILNSIQDVQRRDEIAARLAMHLAGGPAPPRPRRSAGKARAASEGATGTSQDT